MTDIRRRLRAISSQHDLATVIACAFDHRTRILPFIYADMRMVPAGVRAIGSAMLDSGFDKTRIVLQQWNRNFRPQQMRLDGRIPDIFMVSSMHLHSTRCDEMIQDVNKMDASVRPLIIAGGPRIIYSPWEVFGADPDHPWGADVAVTGEEYVLLSLLEVLLSLRGTNESMRSTFPAGPRQRCVGRDSGLGLQPFHGTQWSPRGVGRHGHPAPAGRSRRIAARHTRLPPSGTAQHQADSASARVGRATVSAVTASFRPS